MEIEYSEEEDQYYSLITLKSLNQFKKGNRPLNDFICIDFFGFGDEPSKEQLNAYKFLLENEEKIFNSLIIGAVNSYNSIYLKRFEKHIEFLPKITDTCDLKKAISIENIIISDNHKNDSSFIMFKGECNWDEEHGVCLVMLKDEFITMQSWDYHHR
ncbi:DUF6985 domain-containing protein [Tenacibaculum xiamenense]|uniref:DUF6985 domain-containing protein n=1 Tax=Tenacibaculum xiamenense TaxID=1261553 RepID=UPI003895D786